MELLSQGYDFEDNKLSPEELQKKYGTVPEVLENKAKRFRALSHDEQMDILVTGLTGKQEGTVAEKRDNTSHVFVNQTVLFYFQQLRDMGKDKEWVERSLPFREFVKLPLEEKEKYHNAMVAFHDECRKALLPPGERVLGSSPTEAPGGGSPPPDFSDKSKWEPVNE